MARTTVDIDPAALERARDALETSGVSETVNAALRKVARQRSLADFDVMREIDATPEDIEAGRRTGPADLAG